MIIILIRLCSPYCHFDWSLAEWRNLSWMFVFLNGVFILAFYLNGRMRDPSTALRVTVRGFGFVLMFVICLMAVVGDVCILGRSLGCARDDNGCCALNLGVGLIYLN